MSRPLGSRYVIEEQIGRGGMGEVFRAVDHEGNEYAVKLLRPDLAGDQAIVTRFVQERSILLEVRHRNLVSVHDLVVEGKTLAIVMDLVRGPDLRHALQAVGCLPPAEVARLGGGIAAGLAAVHAADVVHRDIKPENVLLDQSDHPPTVRLTDFGISRLFGPGSQVRTTMLMGTPLYLAPEIAHGDQAGPATDLYSLGIVLYELCCGVSPFLGGEVATVIYAHTSLEPGRPDGIPDPLWDLIAWMLKKQPSARPQSAAHVASLLQDLERRLAGVPAAPLLQAPPRGRATTNPFQSAAVTDFVGEPTMEPTVLPPPAGYWPATPGGSPMSAGMSPWGPGASPAYPASAGMSPYGPGASPAYPASAGMSPYGPGASPAYPASAGMSPYGPPGSPMVTPAYPGMYQAPPPRRGANRALVTIAILLAFILGGGGIAWAVMANRSDDNKVADPTPSPVVTSSPSPTPEGSPSPTPSPTSSPVFTPGGTLIDPGSASVQAALVSFVQNYYATAPDNPSGAWYGMTDRGFQENFSTGLTGYEKYWGTVALAEPSVRSIDEGDAPGTYSVLVQVTVHYNNGHDTEFTTIRHSVIPDGSSFRFGVKFAQCNRFVDSCVKSDA